MAELEKELRVALARVFEHYPRLVMLTGIFSVSRGDVKRLAYEFVIAGEEKVRNRMSLSEEEFIANVMSKWVRNFEAHHHLKPAFVMEWLIDETAQQEGVRAIVKELERQIMEEAKSHQAPPDDWRDMDYVVRTLSRAEPLDGPEDPLSSA